MLFLAVSLGFWIEHLRQEREDLETEPEFRNSLILALRASIEY